MEPYSQKDRKLSRFFARQMLFEFHHGELDSNREKAVKASLEEDAELKRELEFIQRAEVYCRSLQGTRISPDFVTELTNTQSWKDQLSKMLSWRRWPEMARWTVEALAVSAVVMSFVIFVPWSTIGSKLFNRKALEINPSIAIPEVIDAEKINEEDRLANQQLEEIEKSVEEVAKPEVPKAVPTVPVAAVAVAKPTAAPAPQAKTAPKGLLYRMMMNVPDIAAKTSDLKRRIQDMGGAKAGNVELGWRKTNGNYFHFTFPESRYQTLLGVLGEYGAVRVYKNPHDRVMPEGKIRIILWIEDGPNAGNSNSPEAAEEPMGEPSTAEQTPNSGSAPAGTQPATETTEQ